MSKQALAYSILNSMSMKWIKTSKMNRKIRFLNELENGI